MEREDTEDGVEDPDTGNGRLPVCLEARWFDTVQTRISPESDVDDTQRMTPCRGWFAVGGDQSVTEEGGRQRASSNTSQRPRDSARITEVGRPEGAHPTPLRLAAAGGRAKDQGLKVADAQNAETTKPTAG